MVHQFVSLRLFYRIYNKFVFIQNNNSYSKLSLGNLLEKLKFIHLYILKIVYTLPSSQIQSHLNNDTRFEIRMNAPLINTFSLMQMIRLNFFALSIYLSLTFSLSLSYYLFLFCCFIYLSFLAPFFHYCTYLSLIHSLSLSLSLSDSSLLCSCHQFLIAVNLRSKMLPISIIIYPSPWISLTSI